jgi:hypothetical protein
MHGGEGGIRTRDTGLPYTRFPGVLLRPLGHLSKSTHTISKGARDYSTRTEPATARDVIVVGDAGKVGFLLSGVTSGFAVGDIGAG